MPTVLRKDGFRFFFFSNEGNEPAHIHVEHQDSRAKYWRNPVSLVWNAGFNTSALTRLYSIVREYQAEFLERWDEHFTEH